jgi:hypothetical protein
METWGIRRGIVLPSPGADPEIALAAAHEETVVRGYEDLSGQADPPAVRAARLGPEDHQPPPPLVRERARVWRTHGAHQAPDLDR